MLCRVGITTNLDDRETYWDGRVQGMQNFRTISTHYSKSAAQAAEKKKAEQHGCVHFPGGAGDEIATWHVYHFEYTRDMR